VHLEPAETDLNLPLLPGKPPTATRSDQPQAPREGLPAAFKMRRERHYVEQLMGDAPLRTIREIPLADIEPPDDTDADALEPLRQSIETVGILQPLLVSQVASPPRGALDLEQSNRYRLIAGANRFRVAAQLGLRTVPCLVYENGAHTVEALREAASRRATAPTAFPEPPMPSMPEEPRQSGPAAGLREVTARLAFVSAVMPALDVAGYDALRWNILTDLMKVEMERARSTAAAVEWLSSTTAAPVREPIEASAIVDAVLEAVAPEARLQGITLDVASAVDGYRLPADRAMLVRALTGLVQSVLALSPAGSTVRIECSGTAIRPALIVAVTQQDCEVGDTAIERFFDADFLQHPNGPSGALVLAGVAHVARLHGGRAHARAHDGHGCTATFVIPKPLSES
jgi:signal transduction histidine kinase